MKDEQVQEKYLDKSHLSIKIFQNEIEGLSRYCLKWLSLKKKFISLMVGYGNKSGRFFEGSRIKTMVKTTFWKKSNKILWFKIIIDLILY